MTLVVPFDGSELAEAALVRADEFANAFAEDLLAVSVIPVGNAVYARENAWLEEEEPFDLGTVVRTLRERVATLSPDAETRHEVVDRHAPPGTISNRVRRVAREVEASMVFVGSVNAGGFVRALASVGTGIAADDAYDVVVVRHPLSRERLNPAKAGSRDARGDGAGDDGLG